MNRFIKIAIAAGISLTSLSSIGYADPFIMSPGIDTAVRQFQGTDFRVNRVKPSERGDTEEEAAAAKNSPDVRALQASIASNKMLMEQLKAQNVEINNIIDAEAAANGGLVLYVY